ncbi:SIR2 family protein [Terribacillus saccharophilus]|uniref:SIR2 family protein n=1 Tax=Terribacillus saccharophilus TaxID=361277 RepID=UPI002989B6DE|nr:SIR2 family protein [Terribacillus saccharophilus]MCM3225939.1 SIR2 family protein [Terribacillus saccharophilus]
MSNYDSYLTSSLENLSQYIANMKSRPILFVGSGFSQRYISSPTWGALLEQLIKENPNIKMPMQYFIQEHGGDYANIASELVSYYYDYAWENHENEEMFPPFLFQSQSKSVHLKYKIADILIDLMEQFDEDFHELSDELELVKQLNPQAIITTNYDTLLETLFPKYEAIIGQQVIRQKKATDIGHILKIHGSVEDTDSIVIEEQDYKNFAEKQIYLIAKLFTYFVEHPIIFIGYGLNDKNIKSILYNVKQIIDAEMEPMIENMWFIDWSREPINPDESPAKEKSISVGNGESVKVNYIKLHKYQELYKALYQDSVDIEFLKQIEETVYNVVKSDTITNLEVDIASLHYLTDRESWMGSFASSAEDVEAGTKFLTFVDIQEPDQLAAQFPLTATELTKRVYDNEKTHWSNAYSLIDDIKIKTGADVRGGNNMYHVRMTDVTRFSIKAVELLKKVKNLEPYTITIEGEEYVYPLPDETDEEENDVGVVEAAVALEEVEEVEEDSANR